MKMYVIVGKDLSHPQRAVQAGHALAKYLLEKKSDWTNGTLVYLGVDQIADLDLLSSLLDIEDKEHVCFKEPDIGDQVTAIACLGTNKILKRIPLL